VGVAAAEAVTRLPRRPEHRRLGVVARQRAAHRPVARHQRKAAAGAVVAAAGAAQRLLLLLPRLQ
jgi:hypothetical protein